MPIKLPQPITKCKHCGHKFNLCESCESNCQSMEENESFTECCLCAHEEAYCDPCQERYDRLQDDAT